MLRKERIPKLEEEEEEENFKTYSMVTKKLHMPVKLFSTSMPLNNNQKPLVVLKEDMKLTIYGSEKS